MKNSINFALLLAFLVASCSGRVKFDRIETTPLERYSIVYKDAKCGLYDNQADSLVTAVKYDALKYCGTESGEGMEFTMWVGEMEDCQGMLAIGSTTNEPVEIMFPKEQTEE